MLYTAISPPFRRLLHLSNGTERRAASSTRISTVPTAQAVEIVSSTIPLPQRTKLRDFLLPLRIEHMKT